MYNDLRVPYKVVIDPGSGGTDIGATGNNIIEKDYNLLISKYMYDRFKELGIPVAITREEDLTLSPTDRVNSILSKFGNSSDVIVISNHVNAGGGEGAEVIYALRNPDTIAKSIINNIAATGHTATKYYQRRLPSDTSKDYYYIHRDTGKTQPLLINYGYVNNESDAKFLQNNYKELAEAVIKVISNYIGIPYTTPEGITQNTYTVQSGDSLYSIAQKLGTTVKELQDLNNLSTTNLSIGQVLRIPTTPSPENGSNTYIVQKGDTLYTIAQSKGTTIDELKKLNNLTSNLLSIGQTLILPSQLSPNGTYTVQRGDSLYSIAKKLGTTIEDLKSTNNLTTDNLSIGQVLKIPESSSDEEKTTTYTVQSGDSLYSIARKFGTTVDTLKSINNLTTNLLSIGQKLQVPTEDTTQNTYTVQSGDSLYTIARKFGTTIDTLKKLNNLSSNLLSIGQILIIR